MIIEPWNKALKNDHFADWLLKLIIHWGILLTREHNWTETEKEVKFFLKWFHALTLHTGGTVVKQPFLSNGRERCIICAPWDFGLCERRRLERDGYCFRNRRSERRGERTRGEWKRGSKGRKARDGLESDDEIEHQRYEERRERED